VVPCSPRPQELVALLGVESGTSSFLGLSVDWGGSALERYEPPVESHVQHLRACILGPVVVHQLAGNAEPFNDLGYGFALLIRKAVKRLGDHPKAEDRPPDLRWSLVADLFTFNKRHRCLIERM